MTRLGVVGDRPVEPREAVARRVAGDAGIDDAHVMAARLERGFELRRERLARRQAGARRQAVAEGDDLDRFGLGPARGGEQKDEQAGGD